MCVGGQDEGEQTSWCPGASSRQQQAAAAAAWLAVPQATAAPQPACQLGGGPAQQALHGARCAPEAPQNPGQQPRLASDQQRGPAGQPVKSRQVVLQKPINVVGPCADLSASEPEAWGTQPSRQPPRTHIAEPVSAGSQWQLIHMACKSCACMRGCTTHNHTSVPVCQTAPPPPPHPAHRISCSSSRHSCSGWSGCASTSSAAFSRV